ncbi:MAG: multicopper oxidase domain-containing protein [Thermoanaerobaculia bacterium]
MPTRRQVIKYGTLAGAGAWAQSKFGWMSKAYAVPLASGLSDPAVQPKFVEYAPNALDPGFIFEPVKQGSMAGNFNIYVKEMVQQTGLRKNGTGKRLDTNLWGYGYDDERGVSWPGRTFQVQSGTPTTVRWNNDLGRKHLLPVDTSLHWCYSLPGYEHYSIKKNGVPIVTHLHGGHSASEFDGNPEFFWSPDYKIVGPQWAPLGGIIKDFEYLNDQSAGNLWYHDHALGITRLNVYAGLAGFYFVRDGAGGPDDGTPGNSLGLPAWPYELAYAIQDRMFTKNGALFYPAFPGDPAWEDFITGEGLNDDDVPQPSALAEFFGDHMVVNGKIWPKADVEPRNYRMQLLNGTDSRFLVVRFRAVDLDATDLSGAGAPLPFWVIGSDQGLAVAATQTDTLVFEPGGRYDVVFDFDGLAGKRIIMENVGWDAPFGGDFGSDPGEGDVFPDRQTDRIMAFDVVLSLDDATDAAGLPPQAYNFEPDEIDFGPSIGDPGSTRQVALFEGKDEFGRLQPLLGANTWTPENPVWSAIAWHSPTTENPALGDTEEWEIYNFTGDAHPVHLHLVHFEILGRSEIIYESDDGDPGQEVPQHNGEIGFAPVITNVVVGDDVNLEEDDGYVENAPKDMVTALPEQVTRIKVTFDKAGRYVWHCHILSHEDHEMMRVLEVGS